MSELEPVKPVVAAPAALAPIDSAAPAPREHYELIDKAEERLVVSATAPNLKLHVERGLSVTQGTRKKYPRQTIFLDGAYAEAPFLDNESRQYSLDHHAGCVRSFTLSTCEQAAVMLMQGLPLDEGEWHIYINEPDLDALLAAWLLLNHTELMRQEGELLAHAMPIVRVEGVIDAHGLSAEVLTGLPRELLDKAKRQIDELLGEERALKTKGEWGSIDALDYTRRMLQLIDRHLFPAARLVELLSAELVEVARAVIQHHKIALLCRSRRGIYAVEKELQERYDKQLAVIILDQGEGRFTLRQLDRFLTRSLDDTYTLLNIEDPAVTPDNRWGGSTDIGGSPRQSGTALEGERVLALAAISYSDHNWLFRALRLAFAYLRRRWRDRRARLEAGRPQL